MMKKTIRIISAALAPTLVAASLIACSKTDTPTPDTDGDTDASTVTQANTQKETDPTTDAVTDPVTDEVTDAVTQPEPEPDTDPETQPEDDPFPDQMELTSDTKIYVPTDRNRSLKKLSTALIDSIQEKTGLTLTAVLGTDGAPADSEIILGYDATREITTSAYSSIPVGSYGVYTEGSSAVLAVWDESDLQAAADLFVETCLTQQGNRWYVLPHSVADNAADVKAAALSAYRIVYAADADSALVNVFIPNLQQYLLDTYGVRVEAVSDAASPTPYELVIGDTNRTTEEVRAYLEGNTAILPTQQAIVPVESRFFILGRNAGNVSLALSRLLDGLDEHLIGQGTVWHPLAPVSLTAWEEAYVSSPMVTTDRAEVAEGTDLRIMSYNILNQDYVPDNPLPPERDEEFAAVLFYYMPDVVGVQEANLAWHESFDLLFGPSGLYLPACRYHDGENTAQTTFLYNPLTVKLIDEYVIHYTDWDDSDIRVVSFAVFEKLSDGKRFVMTNTHPAPHAEYYSGHIDELIRIKTEEFAKYADLPIIMTGDFNTRESQAQYNQILSSLGMTDARYDEGVELVRDVCTYTSLPSGEAVGGTVTQANRNNIDHIFINDKLNSLLFNVVIDHNVVNISDHLPIYADLIWK